MSRNSKKRAKKTDVYNRVRRVPITRRSLYDLNKKNLHYARVNTFSKIQPIKKVTQKHKYILKKQLLSRQSSPKMSNVKRPGYIKPWSVQYVDSLREFNTKICKSRSTRREVLFAHRKTGKGSSSPKIYKHISKVRC